MKYDSKIIEKWIEEINNNARGLTSWELGFMESINEQFDRSGYLSERQVEVLERIYANKTK